MNWNKGFSSQYYACFVDPVTWKDLDRFEITGGSVKRVDSGMRESADLECRNYQQQEEQWIRIWLDTTQIGSSEHIALFTGIATAPERDIDGKLISNTLTCYSVLKAAQDVLLPLGYYASAGMSGALIVKNLLKSVCPAPIEIIGDSPSLQQHIIAEDNENYLSMSEKILAAINWRIRLQGDGRIQICGMANDVSAEFDPIENDSVEPKLKATNDWYKCPNVFRAIMGDTSAVARDDSPDSPLSTVRRGREVWMEEKDCKLNDNESLAEYAKRRLKEEQRHYLSVSYDRRFHPDVVASDLIGLHYPEQGIDGVFYVSDQSIELNYGARTGEEATQI